MRIPHLLTNKIEMATDSSLVWTLHLRWSRTLLGAAILIRKSSLSSFFIFLAPFLLQTSYMVQHPVTLSPKLCTTTLTGIGMICFCRIGGAWMNNMVHQTLEWWSNWIWYSTGFFKMGKLQLLSPLIRFFKVVLGDCNDALCIISTKTFALTRYNLVPIIYHLSTFTMNPYFVY